MAMMISKFNRMIRSKIVWGAFAFLISVAFVGVYTPGSKDRSQSRRDAKARELAGRLFGEDVSRIELGQSMNAVRVMVTMTAMINPYYSMGDEEMYNRAWERLALLKKAEQMGLHVSEDIIAATIQQIPLFQNRETSQYDPMRYNMFVNQVLPQLRTSPKGFEQIIRENLLVGQVTGMAGQSALATEPEIKKAFHLYNDKLTVEYASIPYSLSPAPEVTEEDARNYFDRNPKNFILPEFVKVDYVRFSANDHLGTVEATDEMVAQYYEENKQDFLKELAEDAPEDAVAEFKPLEEVKGEIVAELTRSLALKAAIDQADTLVAALSNESISFDKAAADLGAAVVKNTPEFSLKDSVAGIDPDDTAAFVQTGHTLQKTSTHYYSDAVVGKDTVYVIALLDKIAPRIPAFEDAKDDAIEYAKLEATETAYVETAEKVLTGITAEVKAGASFADAVAKQKMELKTTEPFDLSSRLEIDSGMDIQSATAWLSKGQMTGLIDPSSGTEFLVAYVAEKVISDEAGLDESRQGLAQQIAGQKSDRLINAWREDLLRNAGFEDLLQRADDES